MTCDFIAFPGRWEMNDCACSCGVESTTHVCKFWSQKGGPWSWLFLFLLLSLKIEINEARRLKAGVTLCATRRSAPGGEKLSFLEGNAFVESLWLHTSSLSTFLFYFQLFSLSFLPPPFSLLYFIFPRFPCISRYLFSLFLSISALCLYYSPHVPLLPFFLSLSSF